jgi:hypothetical protein
VNGRVAELKVEKHWARLERRWQNGDHIKLSLPMVLWVSRLDPQQPTPAAVMIGPVTLAFQAPSPQTLQRLDASSLVHLLEPVPNQPLCFDLVSNNTIHARPFSGFREGERYCLYLDPHMGSVISYRDVAFTGKWNDAGAFRFSNEIGAAAQCEFEGTGVRWLGRRFNDAGQAEVTIDGKVVGLVDQYGPGRDLPFEWSQRGLAPGRHTIRLRLLPDHPEKSTDRYLNVMGFEILQNL